MSSDVEGAGECMQYCPLTLCLCIDISFARETLAFPEDEARERAGKGEAHNEDVQG